MILRQKQALIESLLGQFPAVAILGPRQVGKTTLAITLAQSIPASDKNQKPVYLDLESESDRAKLTDAASYLQQHAGTLVILDEIHRAPELFPTLRGLIDAGRREGSGPYGNGKGRFIILGSAAIDLLRQSSESLAGRIAYVELPPFNLQEVTTGEADESARLHLRGGFPDSFLARSDRASMTWRRDFIRTYLQRDIPQFGPRIAEEALRRFWTMLAHLHGTILNASTVARSLGVDSKTVASYLDLMVDLLLVRRLEPWHANTGKRLIKSPKVYVRDTGLCHALLQIETNEDLLSHPKLGESYEGFVIENLIAAAGEGVEASYYRTAAGAEVDLLLRVGGKLIAVEVKRSLAPKVSKGFHLATEDLKPNRKLVVYPGQETFSLGENIEAMGLLNAMESLRQQA
jgi:predicted AAA+ superfamily ATPase